MMGHEPKTLDLAFLPIEPADLTDDQWSELVSHSHLPPEARSLVGRVIAMYRAFDKARHQSQTATQSRAALGELAKLADKLKNGLIDIRDNPRAIVCLTLALDPRQDFNTGMDSGTTAHKIAGAIDDLKELATWLMAAQNQVKNDRPGARKKSFQIQMLVFVLDDILLRHGCNGISRSTKRTNTSREFVKAVIKIADPTARIPPIEDAMKRRIKARGKTAR